MVSLCFVKKFIWPTRFIESSFICRFQGQEVHLRASPAAGQRGVQAELPDGRVPAPRPTDAHPHPASPAGDGPQAASGAASPGKLHRERRLR